MLSEQFIQDSFHRYLKSSLTQAKVEHLVDADLLSSAEGDLMITGPALCLYFAALRCTTSPPSVPLPKSTKSPSSASEPTDLSLNNCPPAFQPFLRVWSSTVVPIQDLAPEHQHDLARIICSLPPLSSTLDGSVHGIAADLRAVAIEISQRRSFQDRYADDLQAVLDSTGTQVKMKASFVPPPTYEASPGSSAYSTPNTGPAPLPSEDLPNPHDQHQHHNLLSPTDVPRSSHSRNSSSSSTSSTIFTPNSPAIELIRETLYASLGDTLERQPSLRRLLHTDPPRAYFASVAYAVLDVATTSMTSEGDVVGVLGKTLSLAECPRELQPFMKELGAIGREAVAMEEEDTELAMAHAQRGEDIPEPRLERVKTILQQGVGYNTSPTREGGDRRRSLEGRAVAFSNRVNALSLSLTRLKAFRERQEDVFKVLAGI